MPHFLPSFFLFWLSSPAILLMLSSNPKSREPVLISSINSLVLCCRPFFAHHSAVSAIVTMLVKQLFFRSTSTAYLLFSVPSKISTQAEVSRIISVAFPVKPVFPVPFKRPCSFRRAPQFFQQCI